MSHENEVSIVVKKWGEERKPTLVISIDGLTEILQNESAVVGREDVARLMGALHTYSAKADQSDQKALDAWEAVVEEMEDDAEFDEEE